MKLCVSIIKYENIDIHNWSMAFHNWNIDFHDWILDVHNWIMDTHNWIMDIHKLLTLDNKTRLANITKFYRLIPYHAASKISIDI